MNKFKEKFMNAVFLTAAFASVLAVCLICIFLFVNGIPAIMEIGFGEFIFGTEWSPVDIPPLFGIFPMIIGSILITVIAVLLGVPIGVLCAIFLSHVCTDKLYKVIKPCVELLAGIPSVVYGFFGMVIIVPLLNSSIMTAGIVLAIMVLPTVIGISESSLRAVPKQYYEGALALGADHYGSVFNVVVPAAKSGILASIVLGIGRAIGETMAVMMVAGNQPRIPTSLFVGVRTLTANIGIEMGYAQGLHRSALNATGVVLFIFILIINLVFVKTKRGDSK